MSIASRLDILLRGLTLVPLLLLLVVAGVSTAQAEGFQSAAGGMKIKDLKVGTGETAAEGMVATIHFTGWLDDAGAQGREIYNSRNGGEPVSFVIGTENVMPAWNEGVIGMQVGGRRMLLVPPGMAFGNRSINDVIPANAALRMTLELVALE
jgi:FKBP-type peptidyl-prolyl cis-trans isomerase